MSELSAYAFDEGRKASLNSLRRRVRLTRQEFNRRNWITRWVASGGDVGIIEARGSAHLSRLTSLRARVEQRVANGVLRVLDLTCAHRFDELQYNVVLLIASADVPARKVGGLLATNPRGELFNQTPRIALGEATRRQQSAYGALVLRRQRRVVGD